MDGQVISVPDADQRCELKNCDDIKPVASLMEFLKIATAATKALMFLHESYIIHNDLTPAHLVYDQLNQKVRKASAYTHLLYRCQSKPFYPNPA